MQKAVCKAEKSRDAPSEARVHLKFLCKRVGMQPKHLHKGLMKRLCIERALCQHFAPGTHEQPSGAKHSHVQFVLTCFQKRRLQHVFQLSFVVLGVSLCPDATVATLTSFKVRFLFCPVLHRTLQHSPEQGVSK